MPRRPRRAPDDPVRDVVLPVDGIPLHVRVADVAPPEAPVIVLVHGLGMSGRTLEPLTRRLAPLARVYVPDLPGFGGSGRPRRALGVAELGEALRSFVVAAGIAPTVFVGHSLGCQVIGRLAMDQPGSVPAVVWIGPTRDPEAGTVLANALRLLRDAPREPAGLLALAAYDYVRSSPSRMLKTFADAVASAVRPELPALDVPGLVVRGERDPVVPHGFGELIVRLLPGCRLVEVPGAAHGVPYSHPDQIARIVLDFVAVVDTETPRAGGQG